MIEVLQFFLLLLILAILWMHRSERSTRVKPGPKVILDSCGLIDGRIVDIAESGFLQGTLIVPNFIIHELQLLADGSDSHKRRRARQGLDVVKKLQQLVGVVVRIDEVAIQNSYPVDDRLIMLAQKEKASLYTTDLNLAKVAEIAEIRVLNVNMMAQQMRPVVLPSEIVTVTLLQKGANAKQAIGYLHDGTLIVVDDAVRYIGKTVQVKVKKIHQTTAGKMLFGVLVMPAESKSIASKPRPTTTKTLAHRLRR